MTLDVGERYREFLDTGLLAVYDASPDGRVVACNDACARLLGFASAAEAVGHQLTVDDGPAVCDRAHTELRTRDGGSRQVVLTRIGEFDAAGTLIAVRGYAIDVSDVVAAHVRLRQRERELEERLRQAEKMETIGRLAGGVAHDFNNLLTAILGYCELLLTNAEIGDLERGDIEEIQKAGQRAASLTQQLLAFSRRQMLMPKDVDLGATVRALRTMLLRLIREDIRLTCDVTADPVVVHIDPIQLEQVLLNLVLNACDALPAGGEIRVGVDRVSATDTPFAADAVPVPADAFVRLRVSDNGVGMPAETRAHLFEPFFTTKGVGKGSGLGLASVYGIVRQSNGWIAVDSEPGAGTTFTMYFPAAVAQIDEPESRPTARDQTSAGVILLVEDEATVRAFIAAALRRQGYSVLEAEKPSTACSLFERHRAEIDLLLTDVVMPEMNGPALAQRLVEARPDLRILFISGYAEALRPLDIEHPFVGFLGKPFEPSEVVARVRELLGGGPRAHTGIAGAAT